MQHITHWPDITEMALPESVSQDLHQRLLEPFDSTGEAKAFWDETSSTIIVLSPTDPIKDLKGSDASS